MFMYVREWLSTPIVRFYPFSTWEALFYVIKIKGVILKINLILLFKVNSYEVMVIFLSVIKLSTVA